MVSEFDDLVARCRRAMSQASGPAAIAIDGHSAAGKSTLADRLTSKLDVDVAVVRGDDFYSVMAEKVRARLSPPEGVEHYFDWRRMRDQAITPLLDRVSAVYRPYDWANNKLSAQEVRIDPAHLVIVEGLFVARPEISGLFDLTVLVESDPQIRAVRQGQRDDDEVWVRRWDDAERYYFENVRPPDSFDIRISGNDA
jgi:uridine kinase